MILANIPGYSIELIHKKFEYFYIDASKFGLAIRFSTFYIQEKKFYMEAEELIMEFSIFLFFFIL